MTELNERITPLEKLQTAESLNEHYDMVRSLGGTMCNCPLPVALGPAGMCPNCGVEGPFYQQALQHHAATHNGTDPHMTEGIASKYKRVDWREAFKSQPDEVDWLFPPLIEAGTVNALFGLPGVGKSLLTLDIALQIIAEGKTVMVCDEENRQSDLVERLKKFGKGPDDLDQLIVYSFASLPALDTVEGGRHLLALAEDCEPALVILDTAGRMLEGDENNASTYLAFYRNSLVPLKGKGIATLRLDHQGKDASKGQRGSSAKDGDVDTTWRLRFQDGGLLALEREKTRSSHGEEWVLIERMENPLRHRFVELDHFPVTDKIRNLSMTFDRWGIPADAGRPTLRAALKDRGVKDHEDERKGGGVSTTLLALVAKYRKEQVSNRAGIGQ